jgi:hypothetical protein
MHRLLNRWNVFNLIFIFSVCLLSPGLVFGQAGGGDGGGGGNGGGGNGGGGGGNGGGGSDLPPIAGVEIDTQGVLRVMQQNPLVTRMQLMAAKQSLPPQLARPSRLRKVSLNRLEKAVSQRLANGQMPSGDMVALAGLNRLEYVFFYPESGDIVIAGPAEGFGRDSIGRIVGVDSGQPCLLLDDVVVALRSFGPASKAKNKTISVSIDPTEAGLARMQQALRQIGGTFSSAAEIPAIVGTLRQALGFNDVTITGVPAGTHFAHVLTEADYRMKLIGIGLEPVPVPMTNYVGRLTPAMASSNALIRWYFVPNYDAILVSPDGTSMQLTGSGVKLIDEGERVDASGKRKSVGRTNPASRGYAAEFTKKFNHIAAAQPVYAQLRNLMDLSVAAAFIQQQGLYEQSGWDLGVLGDEDKLSVELLPPPQQVETAINAVMVGSRLITPIGGGVSIQARKLLQEGSVKVEDSQAITNLRSAGALESLEDGQWWWD